MSTPIIDFHTHAFPDELAGRAIAHLEAEGGIKARLDGRVSSLLAAMDRTGISTSVVCSIATRPGQFDSILAWSRRIASERIIPFPSIHPADPDYREHLEEVAGSGFKGIKLHPYYQDFDLDSPALFPVYEELCRHGLILQAHTGFDFAFEYVDRCGPARIMEVVRRYPELKLVATHLGAWKQWDEVEDFLAGRPVYLEISFSLEFLDREQALRILSRHDPGRILYGSDSPWTDQQTTLELFQGLELGPELEAAALAGNARRLLGLNG